jgi:hypothetical protein
MASMRLVPRRKRTWVFALLTLAGLFALLIVVLLPFMSGDSLSVECARIRNGMTMEQVEAILGPPTWTDVCPSVIGRDGSPVRSTIKAHWLSGSDYVQIGLNGDGVVFGCNYKELTVRHAIRGYWYRFFHKRAPF